MLCSCPSPHRAKRRRVSSPGCAAYEHRRFPSQLKRVGGKAKARAGKQSICFDRGELEIVVLTWPVWGEMSFGVNESESGLDRFQLAFAILVVVEIVAGIVVCARILARHFSSLSESRIALLFLQTGFAFLFSFHKPTRNTYHHRQERQSRRKTRRTPYLLRRIPSAMSFWYGGERRFRSPVIEVAFSFFADFPERTSTHSTLYSPSGRPS